MRRSGAGPCMSLNTMAMSVYWSKKGANTQKMMIKTAFCELKGFFIVNGAEHHYSNVRSEQGFIHKGGSLPDRKETKFPH